MFYGQILDHVSLGSVVLVSRRDEIARVVKLDEFRSARLVKVSRYEVRMDVQYHEVETRDLRIRAEGSRETLAAFMARKHDYRWKPKPLAKPRKLPRLSDEKFAALMLEQGARQVSA